MLLSGEEKCDGLLRKCSGHLKMGTLTIKVQQLAVLGDKI